MNDKNQKNIAAKIFSYVLKNGGSAASALFSRGEMKEISVRNGEIETKNIQRTANVEITAWFDKKVATVSGPWRSPEEILELAEKCCEMARFNREDPFALLAEKHLWPANILELVSRLRLTDAYNTSLDEMRDFALSMENAGLSVPGVTVSGGARMKRVAISCVFHTTEGFEHGFDSTFYDAGVSCLAGADDDMHLWGFGDDARHFSLLRNPEEMGRLAGETAVSFLGASSIPTARMPIVFDRYVSDSILGHLTQAVNGERIHQKKSFLGRESIGVQIFSPGIGIVSNPLIPELTGSQPFNGEGVASKRLALVSNGVLESFVTNLRSAAKLGTTPTGSLGNLHMENGITSREELIGGIDRGLLVMEFFGQGVNIATGDYSRGASGFLIENGKITRPVNEVTVAGNLKDMFKRLLPANDLELGRWNTPTLRIDGMTVAGKE